MKIDTAGEIQHFERSTTGHKIVAQVVEAFELDSEIVIRAEGEGESGTIGKNGGLRGKAISLDCQPERFNPLL